MWYTESVVEGGTEAVASALFALREMRPERKVRAPQGAAVDNFHREQSSGKWHRNHTAAGRSDWGAGQ